MTRKGKGKWSALVGEEEADKVARAVSNIKALKTMKGLSLVVNEVFTKHAELATSGVSL